MWYFFTAEETSQITATVSDYDWAATISVFSGSCGDDLKCETSNDYNFLPLPIFPFIAYLSFSASFTATAGTSYYIVVSGADGFSPDGNFRLDVEVSRTNHSCSYTTTTFFCSFI